MNKLARLSAEERNRIISGFYDEVFGGLDIDPEFEQRLRSATPDLPDDPTPEQVEAWIELAELVADPGFRARVREMAEGHSATRQPQRPMRRASSRGNEVMPEHARGFEMVVAEQAGAALAAGIDPASEQAAAVLVPIMDALRGELPDSVELRATTAERFAAGNDRHVERYWQLLGVINGWDPFPSMTPAFEWTVDALRAHPTPLP